MNAIAPIAATDLNTEINHEPRIKDLRLAERLGFANPLAIRKLIERNMAELLAHGVISTMEITSTAKGGRPGKEFWLNESQALLVCMFSRTPIAADVRRELIAVYKAWREGALAARNDTPAINKLAHDWAKNDFRRYQAWLAKYMKNLRAIGWTDTAEAALANLGVDPALIGRDADRRFGRAGMPDGRYLVVVRNGEVVETRDIAGHSCVDGEDPRAVHTFLREFVSVEALPSALEVLALRCAVALKHGPKGAPMPKRLERGKAA